MSLEMLGQKNYGINKVDSKKFDGYVIEWLSIGNLNTNVPISLKLKLDSKKAELVDSLVLQSIISNIDSISDFSGFIIDEKFLLDSKRKYVRHFYLETNIEGDIEFRISYTYFNYFYLEDQKKYERVFVKNSAKWPDFIVVYSLANNSVIRFICSEM